jgi:hypothetical protein
MPRSSYNERPVRSNVPREERSMDPNPRTVPKATQSLTPQTIARIAMDLYGEEETRKALLDTGLTPSQIDTIMHQLKAKQN